MLRILTVVPQYEPASFGGIVSSVVPLCRSLAKVGHKVTVYTTDSNVQSCMDVPLAQPVQVNGVEVWYFHTPMPKKIQYSRSLQQACRGSMQQYDIVHLHSLWEYCVPVAAKAARRAGVPYVISPRGTLMSPSLHHHGRRKGLFLRLLGIPTLEGAAAIHYTSELEREMSRAFASDRPSYVLPNGVDMTRINGSYLDAACRRRFGLGKDDFVVGHLGRLHPGKALDILIEAVQLLVRDGITRCKLLLAGPDDGDATRLKRMVTAYGLARYVQFLGAIPPHEISHFLHAINLLSLVSRSENFGNVVAEGMAASVPVVVSDKAGVSTEVLRADGGWVVPVTTSALADALYAAMRSPEECAAKGERAAQYVRHHLATEKVAERMCTAYTDILIGAHPQAT